MNDRLLHYFKLLFITTIDLRVSVPFYQYYPAPRPIDCRQDIIRMLWSSQSPPKPFWIGFTRCGKIFIPLAVRHIFEMLIHIFEEGQVPDNRSIFIKIFIKIFKRMSHRKIPYH
jgi:hypothetical protein